MSREELIIDIPRDGPMRFIYDDRLLPLIQQGEARIQRKTHVEPGLSALNQDPLKWYASVIDGPVLGPFNTHEEAIAEEIKWLKANNLGQKPS